MTIQAAYSQTDVMEQTAQPLSLSIATAEASDVSAESELEEGEINDDVEFIQEVIRQPHPPQLLAVSVSGKPILAKSLSNPRSSLSIQHSSHPPRKADPIVDLNGKRPRLHSSPVRRSGNNGGTLKDGQRHTNSVAKISKAGGSQNRRSPPQRARSPSKNQSGKIYSELTNRVGSNGRNPQPKSSSSVQASRDRRPSSNQLSSSSSKNVKDDASGDLTKRAKSESVKEAKWVPAFEPTASCCSVESMDIDTPSDDDEELGLRLAALHSVVSNNKKKEVVDPQTNTDQSASSNCLPVEAPSVRDEVQDDDFEDEELLRAQLLIDVAQKQAKELEMRAQSEKAISKAADIEPIPQSLTPAAPTPHFVAANKNVLVKSSSQQLSSLSIPIADRLVINLGQDSSSDEDDVDESVADSITALLKSARQSVEQKDAAKAAALVQDMSVLPPNKQEEYQRLKMELERLQNCRLERRRQQQAPTSSSRPVMLTQSQTENLPAVPRPPSKEPLPVATKPRATTVVAHVPSPPTTSLSSNSAAPALQSSSSPASSSPASSSKENRLSEQTVQPTTSAAPAVNSPIVVNAAKKTLSSTSPARPAEPPSPSVAKSAAIKDHLLRKKRELANTKQALKNQLELVDKNRTLWLKSSQEVSRLKALLQTAEDTEKQLLGQLTTSQEHMQRLKTKMQTVEKQIGVLHQGLRPLRVRRNSVKARQKAVGPASTHAIPSNAPAPVATKLRVKPKVVARALANSTGMVSQTQSPAALQTGKSADLSGLSVAGPFKKTITGSVQKNTVKYHERWLFGTLGEVWDDGRATANVFPGWTPHEHFNRSTNAKFRVDPSVTICPKQPLDFTSCQDVLCAFQHLPAVEVSTSVSSSVAETLPGLAEIN